MSSLLIRVLVFSAHKSDKKELIFDNKRHKEHRDANFKGRREKGHIYLKKDRNLAFLQGGLSNDIFRQIGIQSIIILYIETLNYPTDPVRTFKLR